MCTICQYNQTQDVDRALLAGATLASLKEKYGFSIAVLHRHQKHLSEKIRQAQTRLRDHLGQHCLFKLNRVLEMAMHTARTATGEGNSKIALQGTREVTRIITLMTKLDFELDPEMVYCLLGSHEWVGYHGLLPTDSEVIPKIRQTMAENLFTPCPELAANQDQDPDPTPHSTVKTQNSEPEPFRPPLSTRKTVYRKRKTGNEKREPTWEKGGKLPGKIAFPKMKTMENQEDMMLEKNIEKTTESSPPAGPAQTCRR